MRRSRHPEYMLLAKSRDINGNDYRFEKKLYSFIFIRIKTGLDL